MTKNLRIVLGCLLLLGIQFCYSQNVEIRGTVTDSVGVPLPGVNVYIENSNKGVQTDFDGNYMISALSKDVLVFSYVGFINQRSKVGNKTKINIKLSQELSELNQVVIIGYGNQRRSYLTSALSSVDGELIEQVPISSFDQILQGRVAGLQIATGSGQPGEDAEMRIRGTSSILGENEPLIVIDGMPVDNDNFRSLNSNDIESLSVLKDASASAIYGNRSAAGVILIETKRSNYNTPLSVTYRSLYGLSVKPKQNFDLLNSAQLLNLQNELGFGLGSTLSPEERELLASETNTNWNDVILRQGSNLSHEIDIYGGGESFKTYNSLNYFEQEGITPGSGIKRFSMRNNMTARTDLLKIKSSLALNFSENNFILERSRDPFNAGGDVRNPFLATYVGLPYLDPFNADGSVNNLGNGTLGLNNIPYIVINRANFDTDQEEEIKVIGSIQAEYQIANNLKIKGSFGTDYQQNSILEINSPNGLIGQTLPSILATSKGSRNEGLLREFAVNANASLAYNKYFDQGSKLEIAAFTEYYKQSRRFFEVTGFGINPNLLNSFIGVTAGDRFEDPNNTPDNPNDDIRFYIPTFGGLSTDSAILSYFGVLRYNYEEKYGIQGSVRRDASSRLSPENRWATFYSASGLWNIHQENFLSEAVNVNQLKLRASYGVTGNQNYGLDQLYATDSRYTPGIGYDRKPVLTPSSLGNPDLTWERSKQTNFGLDFAFYNFRVSGTLDVYERITDDLFLNAPISLVSGFSNYNSNLGSISNQGVELTLALDLISNKDAKVTLFGNAAYNQNKILSINDNGIIVNGGSALSVGRPLSSFYLVRYLGVNPSNGEPLYLDTTNQVTNQYTEANRVFIDDKTAEPKYIGGFGLEIRYKSWQFNSLFSFAADQYRFNRSLELIENIDQAGISNLSVTVLDRWREPGDITDIPALGFSRRNLLTNRYLEDASYLRLRNIKLSYTISDVIFKGFKAFKSMNLYAQAQNLVTWSKWRGFDPESNFGDSFFDYPTPRIFTFGININFN